MGMEEEAGWEENGGGTAELFACSELNVDSSALLRKKHLSPLGVYLP